MGDSIRKDAMFRQIWKKEWQTENNLWISILGSGIDFSTTSMTGSGGFTPGTPVSTHFKRLSKKHREIHHKRYKKNRLEKNSKLNGKLFLKKKKKNPFFFPFFKKKKKKKKKS